MSRLVSTAARLLPVIATCLLFAPSAHAHLMNTGLGPFYDGVLHLLLSPADLLPLVALSIYAGLRGAAPGRSTLFMLPVSWLAGGLIGLRLDAEISIPAATTLVVIATGLLVATDARLPRGAVTTLAAAGGLFYGLLNGSAMASSGAGLRGVAGMVCSAFVVGALLSALAVSLRGGWPRIALRVAGSWISAIGILMLGWTLRGQL